MASDIRSSLLNLSQEARELYLSSEVTEVDSVPSPLKFYREFVSHNRPLVIRGGVKHWPALQRWSNQYLRDRIGDKEVTVTVTPNGMADAPHGDLFVMPEERTMKMAEFLDIMEIPDKENGVFYIQKQNSNLTDEFSDIIDDIDSHVDWATEAFGKKPDAVNFWLGDSRAVTSMHKDPYENIYCVIRGHKELILQPPTDLTWIPYKMYPPAIYQENKETAQFEIKKISAPVIPWICVDPLDPDLEKYPDYDNSTCLKVKLEAGDLLYLPSLWFHHLTQSHGCIAVNFWYDMEFDIKYNYFNLVDNLKKMIVQE